MTSQTSVAAVPPGAAAGQTWRDRAACHGNDVLFLSERPKDVAQAQRICLDCPVFDQCQDYAKQIRPTAGVWAGRDCNDRRKRGKRPIPVRSLREHGAESEPHSCRRPECAEQSRAYKRAHEAARYCSVRDGA